MKIEDLMIRLSELDKQNKDAGVGMTADQVMSLLPKDMEVVETFQEKKNLEEISKKNN